MMRFVSVTLVMAMLGGSAVAHADGGGHEGDVLIETKDGALFRGRLMERIPGQYVSIELASGETRRIATSAIARETDEASTAGHGELVEPRRTVHIEFNVDDDRAELQRLDEDQWIAVCPGPCSVDGPADAVYRIGGNGVRRSTPFRLPEDERDVPVTAEAGSTSTTVWGAVLAIGGGSLALTIGLPVLAIGFVANGDDSSGDGTAGVGPPLIEAGAVMTVGGVIAGVAGLIMVLNNRTHVKVGSAVSLPRLGTDGRSPGVAVGGGAPPMFGLTF